MFLRTEKFVSAANFLYLTTLEMPWGQENFPRVSLKYRAALMLCYGAGLRVGEAVAIKASNIDSDRMLIRIEQGKSGKDRFTMLSPRLLTVLHTYWRAARPAADYHFPSWRTGKHLNASSCRRTRRRDGKAF